MQKKIAIMIIIILMAGTFTACTTGEKVNNDIKTSVVSKVADVSVSTEISAITTEKTTETTRTEKATVSKETEQVFRKRIRFKKHNPRLRTTAGIQ